jgi:urease accessory protein
MIEINKIYGNINFNESLKSKYLEMSKNGKVESIMLTRPESEKIRMRKVSDKGTELAFIMPSGSCLIDGDVVLLDHEKIIIVKRKLESVGLVTLLPSTPKEYLLETAVKVGHTIGNLHRPIRIQGNKVCFPIQGSSELELLEKLFANLREHLEIESDYMIFDAEPEYKVHEH